MRTLLCLFMVGVGLCFAGCSKSVDAGCTSDDNCKGDRICVKRECVEPQRDRASRVTCVGINECPQGTRCVSGECLTVKTATTSESKAKAPAPEVTPRQDRFVIRLRRTYFSSDQLHRLAVNYLGSTDSRNELTSYMNKINAYSGQKVEYEAVLAARKSLKRKILNSSLSPEEQNSTAKLLMVFW